MRKLIKLKNGEEYITGGILSMVPHIDYQPEEYDLSGLTDSEFEEFKKNKNDKRLRKKMRKL